MPRGGRRNGKVGKAYAQRRDMQGPPTAEFRGQTYGDRKAQVEAQRAVPTGPPPTANIPTPQPQQTPTGPGPGGLGDLLAPTARPDEPITAGAPFGPGPGPNPFLAPPQAEDPDLTLLRELYRSHESPALRELIEFMESE